MLELLLSSPIARKVVLYGSLVAALLVGLGVEEMRIRYAHSQEDKAKAAMVQAQTQRDQALAANAQLKGAIEKQNAAIKEMVDQTVQAKVRQAAAEERADKINHDYQEWLLRIRGASVPKDSKNAWAWFVDQYNLLNSKFQETK